MDLNSSDDSSEDEQMGAAEADPICSPKESDCEPEVRHQIVIESETDEEEVEYLEEAAQPKGGAGSIGIKQEVGCMVVEEQPRPPAFVTPPETPPLPAGEAQQEAQEQALERWYTRQRPSSPAHGARVYAGDGGVRPTPPTPGTRACTRTGLAQKLLYISTYPARIDLPSSLIWARELAL